MSTTSSIRDEITRSTEGLPLLGYTVQWSLRGLQVEHDGLVKVLSDAGFGGYAPDPPTPRKALRRAIESWVLGRSRSGQGPALSGRYIDDEAEGEEEGARKEGKKANEAGEAGARRRQMLVRTINRRDSDYLVFALVLEEADLRSLGLSYGTDLRVLLRKSDLSMVITTTAAGRTAESSTSPVPPVASGLPEHWAHYHRVHSASDLSRIFCQIVRGMGAISLRAGGGTYFVPPAAATSLERLRTMVGKFEALSAAKAATTGGASTRENCSFLLTLGVPDAQAAKRSLARAAHTSFMDELGVMQTDLQRFNAAPEGTVKPKTISERLLQYKEMHRRAEMYATLLDMQKDQIFDSLRHLEAQALAVVMAGPVVSSNSERQAEDAEKEEDEEDLDG